MTGLTGPRRAGSFPEERLVASVTLRAGVFVALLLLLSTPVAVAAPEGQLTWGVHTTLVPAYFDPAETIIGTSFMVLYGLHDALVKPLPGKGVAPALAESWTVSPDGLVYEFVLRKGAKFHNGEPVTAEDAKFSWDRYRGIHAKTLKEHVAAVDTPDPGRVRIRLKQPWPDFLTYFGTVTTSAAWVVPKKYVEKVGDEGFKKAPIGAGPYRFVSFTPGIELVLEAFDGYWRKAPSIKRLVMRSMPEESTRAAALRAGEVDIAFLLTGPTADSVRKVSGFRLAAPLVSGAFWLELPEQWDPKSPWADARVRLAASHAIDRPGINQAEMLGFGRLTGNYVPRIFQFAVPMEPHAYDPAKAKKLLAEAGYANGCDAGDCNPFPPSDSFG